MGFLQKFIVKGFLKHFKRAKAKPEVCAGEYSHFPSPQLATTGWAPTQQPYQTEHNQRMEFEDGEAPPVRDEVQCSTCGRSFAPHVLARHANVCKTSTNKKRRKVFDSSRQRAEGTDISQLKPVKPKAEPPKKPNNWRQKHDDFIASIRASKVAFQAVKEGKELPPPPPPTYDPDYIQCPHCQRRFNESAAERHINFCKEQAARIPNKGKLEAKKTPSRTQFKPPSLKKPSASAAAAAAPAAPPAAPSTSTRLPQRAGLGQPTGIAYNRTSSAGATRNAPSGYTSPPSGVGGKTRVTSSGYGSARNTPPAMAQNRRSADNCGPRDGGVDAVNNGGVKSKFCHSCGTRYPVESAKFCCECGIRRMCF